MLHIRGIVSTFAIFSNRDLLLWIKRVWQLMMGIWARTAGNLYLNKMHANNYVSTQIHMLPTANILSLSLLLPVQLSDWIWISDSTRHTAGWRANRESGETRQVLIGLVLQCCGLLLKLGGKKTSQNVKVPGSIPLNLILTLNIRKCHHFGFWQLCHRDIIASCAKSH